MRVFVVAEMRTVHINEKNANSSNVWILFVRAARPVHYFFSAIGGVILSPWKIRTHYPTKEQNHYIASIDWCSAAISWQTGNADIMIVVRRRRSRCHGVTVSQDSLYFCHFVLWFRFRLFDPGVTESLATLMRSCFWRQTWSLGGARARNCIPHLFPTSREAYITIALMNHPTR
jgi:hypothetical protein